MKAEFKTALEETRKTEVCIRRAMSKILGEAIRENSISFITTLDDQMAVLADAAKVLDHTSATLARLIEADK